MKSRGALFAFLVVLAVASSTAAEVIDSATINYTSNQVTILGSSFSPIGKAPSVYISTTKLAVVSFSNAEIIATLPKLAVGSYNLTVVNTSGISYTFDLTYGAAGPQGPVGPQGPIGKTGATGPQGPIGLIGPAGPQGPIGLTGATGATGPEGPIGLTGAAGPMGSAGPQGPTGATGSQGPQGPAGVNGLGFNFQGSYNSSQLYNLNDVVTFGGSSYVSLVGSNQGNEPDTSTTQWAAMAQQGSAGPQGPAGLTGPMGPMGLQGVAGPAGPQGPTGATGPQGASPFSLNGTTAYYTGGNVSIGEPAPTTSTPLTVRSPSDIPQLYLEQFNNPNGGWQFRAGFDGGLHVTSYQIGRIANPFLEALTIPDTGNVGIGTANPQATLDVNGNIAVAGTPVINSSGQWVGSPSGLQGPAGPQGATGPQGPQGVAGTNGTNGTGFNFRGAFNTSNTYATNDVVTYAPANVTYNVNVTFGSAGSMVGTITTDGTIGVLSTSNIVSWHLTLADSATNSTLLTPSNSTFGSGNNNTGGQPNSDFTATSTTLTMTYSNGGFWYVAGASGEFCMTDWSNCFGPVAYGTWNINGDNAYSESAVGDGSSQIIGTGGTVATPVTSTYVATAPVAAGTAIPGTSPWVMMAQAGAPGAAGAQGPQGVVGPQGPAGANGTVGPQGPAGPQGLAGISAGYMTSVPGTTVSSNMGNYKLASLTLPAGTYMFFGRLTTSNGVQLACSVMTGTTTVDQISIYLYNQPSPAVTSAPLIGAVTIPANGPYDLSTYCAANGIGIAETFTAVPVNNVVVQ